MDQEQIETKLAAARTKLILDKPFLGALVMRLPMEAADADWCPATATDARKFYYNPEFIDQLSLDETQFMLAHEALHCALSHFARRLHRTKLHWDMACDYAINPLLIGDGLKAPPGSLYLPQFEGMTAEEIYPCLDEKDDDEPLDNHVYDKDNSQTTGSGKSEKEMSPDESDKASGKESEDNEKKQGGSGKAAQPPPLTPDEAETLNIQWQQRMAGAAQQAMQAGKLDGAMARMVDHLLQPQLPWRLLLARYMTAIARDDFSYMRPSRREGEFILPSLRSNQLELVVALDTSGSIQDHEMGEFLAEINASRDRCGHGSPCWPATRPLPRRPPGSMSPGRSSICRRRLPAVAAPASSRSLNGLRIRAWRPICWSTLRMRGGHSPGGNPTTRSSGWSRGRTRPPGGSVSSSTERSGHRHGLKPTNAKAAKSPQFSVLQASGHEHFQQRFQPTLRMIRIL